jgi:hypothetical protein
VLAARLFGMAREGFEAAGDRLGQLKVSANMGMLERLRGNLAEARSAYEKAIALGATDEGKPGFRPEGASSGFYCGYFRDLDGNKLNAFCLVVE